MGCLTAACHSKIDLGNVEPQAEVAVGLALPVGTIRIGMTDLLPKSDNMYIDSLDNKGVITWKASYPIERNYHNLKLESYVPGTHIDLKVYDKLGGLPIFDNGKITTPATVDVPISLDFDLALKLNGLNNKDSLNNARLDSALIKMASFASTIKTQNGLPLEWDWIDSVVLDLGDRINRPNKRMMVYQKGNPQFAECDDFGKKVETNVDNFSIVLMKDPNPRKYEDYIGNVVDSCNFNIKFDFTIPRGTTLIIPKEAGFRYDLDVQFLTYEAVWGMFKPSKDMSAEEIQDLSSSWGELDFLTKSSMPFAAPRIKVDITTQIAGAMRIDSAYIFSVDQSNQRTYAQFGKNKKEIVTRDLENWLPLKSQIGDSTTMFVTFDSTSDGGRINRLFRNIPKKIGYCFNVRFYQPKTPQIRITPNTAVKVNAQATLPMIFDKGLYIKYTDTLDMKLSQYSIDSLTANSKVVDSISATEITLFLKAQNEIPVDMKAAFRCYDENDSIIKDPSDPTKPFLLFPKDTIRIVAPTLAFDGTSWVRQAPGETSIVARMTKKKLNVMPKIKYILYDVIIDDESLQSNYDKGQFNVKLTNEDKLGINIGLTAQIDAILNLGAGKNEDNE